MNQSLIYHGGPAGKQGFPASSGGGSSYLYDRIWISSDELQSYPSFPPNGPSTRTLPNTLVTRVWTFAPDQLDIVFAWFALPSRYWTYATSAPTGLRLIPHYYVDSASVAPNDVIDFRAALIFFRCGEVINVAGPSMTALPSTCGVSNYQLCCQNHDDFPIINPYGASTEVEGIFYLKFERVGSDPSDTYPNEAHLLGIAVDIPLKF